MVMLLVYAGDERGATASEPYGNIIKLCAKRLWAAR
jgi:hypothetical protein